METKGRWIEFSSFLSYSPCTGWEIINSSCFTHSFNNTWHLEIVIAQDLWEQSQLLRGDLCCISPCGMKGHSLLTIEFIPFLFGQTIHSSQKLTLASTALRFFPWRLFRKNRQFALLIVYTLEYWGTNSSISCYNWVSTSCTEARPKLCMHCVGNSWLLWGWRSGMERIS